MTTWEWLRSLRTMGCVVALRDCDKLHVSDPGKHLTDATKSLVSQQRPALITLLEAEAGDARHRLVADVGDCFVTQPEPRAYEKPLDEWYQTIPVRELLAALMVMGWTLYRTGEQLMVKDPQH